MTPALDALYRDGTLQVQATIEATEAALAGLSVGVSLWRGEEQIAAGRQPLGTPTVDERGHYAERVDFSWRWRRRRTGARKPRTVIAPWSPCGAATNCWRPKRGTSVFAASRLPMACCVSTVNRC
ncbi:hypothetical protein LNP20_09050 [Klebsiella pneumoniae subsp. pneumoniae]|nr:hypothetical protein [Klebsiella pneumoniae subsp. pneumoniae]